MITPDGTIMAKHNGMVGIAQTSRIKKADKRNDVSRTMYANTFGKKYPGPDSMILIHGNAMEGSSSVDAQFITTSTKAPFGYNLTFVAQAEEILRSFHPYGIIYYEFPSKMVGLYVHGEDDWGVLIAPVMFSDYIQRGLLSFEETNFDEQYELTEE